MNKFGVNLAFDKFDYKDDRKYVFPLQIGICMKQTIQEVAQF